LPKTGKNYFHHPKFERRVYLLGTVLTFSLGFGVLWFLWEYFFFLGLGILFFLSIFGVLFLITWRASLVRVGYTKQGLVLFTPQKVKRYPFKDLVNWRLNPSSGYLLLVFGDQKVSLSLRLRGFYHLRDLLIPHLKGYTFKEEELPLRFNIAKTAQVVYVFFLLAVVAFTVLWWEEVGVLFGMWGYYLLILSSLSLLGSLFARLFFLIPWAYVFHPEGIEVVFLLRKVKVFFEDMISFREDHYAKGGVIHYLQRIEFPQRNVILDEMYLEDSLWRIKDWVRSHVKGFDSTKSRYN